MDKSKQKYVDFYILAGQSNMNGHGFVSDLPAELKKQKDDVWIYNPNRREDQQLPDDEGFWEVLQPGHGTGAAVQNGRRILSDRFGPELSFARTLRQEEPGRSIAIYKYAKGGSSIHADAAGDWGCWAPDYRRGNGINQWTHFCHHLHRSLEQVKEMFNSVQPAGIVWHQGESDASHTRTIAESYAGNLSNILNRMREEVGDRSLPVVVGQISDSMLGRGKRRDTYPFGEIVKSAQRQFVEQDNHAALVTAPEEHGFIDAWHYDSQTYIDLGVRFAYAMIELQNVEKKMSHFQSNE